MAAQPAQIETVLQRALEGERSAIEQFFTIFRETEFSVPRRQQRQQLSDSPTYPSEFFDLLGVYIKAEERSAIPIFTRLELVSEWCGTELECTTLTGAALLDRVPESWSVVVNPGLDVEKELSDWEVQLLRQGIGNIPELVEESMLHANPPSVQIRVLDSTEYSAVRQALYAYCEQQPAILDLSLVEERVEQEGEETRIRLLVLGRVHDEATERILELNRELDQIAAPLLIGNIALAARLESVSRPGMHQKLGAGVEPVFTRKSGSLLGKIRSIFR